MPYIGSTPTTQSFISGTDYFNGTGSQTAFTLSRTVASQNDVEAVVNNVVQQPNAGYTISGTTITFTSAPSAGTQNVYVRYLSTTTQSIAPAQGTVGWNQLDTNTQQDLGISFKNRIINGAMVIDQRNAGASVTPTDGQYTLDRWRSALTQTGKYTVQQTSGNGFGNSLGVTSTSAYSVISSDFFAIQQRIEGFNFYDLQWGTANAKTVTLSFTVKSSLTGTFGGSFYGGGSGLSYPFTYTINSANTWEQKSVTITAPTTGSWIGATNGTAVILSFNLGAGSTYSTTAGSWVSGTFTAPTGATSVVGTNGATWYITGVQLEVGTQATTFDNRAYGTELALCQRYYFKVEGSGTGSTTFASGYNQSTTTAVGFTPFKVSMRDRPTALEQSGTAANYTVAHGAASTACSSVPTFASRTSLNGGSTVFTVASGLTAGQGCELTTANAATSYLAWSAEL